MIVGTLFGKRICKVVSEKNETFFCELMLDRYIYLRITQKQLKISTENQTKVS